MSNEETAPMTVAQRIAALQKQQGYSKPLTPPQRPPNEVSGRIADLQKNVEPAFLSSREKAEEEKAKSGEEVDETPNEVVDEQTKPKRAFKPPPGAVQVMLPQFTAKQKMQADESD